MVKDRRKRRRVTLMYDTGAREDDALESFRWVLPGVLVVTGLIWMFTLLGWYVPHFPMLIFGAVVLVPMSMMLVWQSESKDPRNWGLAIGLVMSFGLPLVAWNVGLYRAMALFTMGDFLPDESAVAAMADRNDRVTAMACTRLMQGASYEVWEGRIQAVLEVRPEVAGRCLDSVQEQHPGRTQAMARYLNRQWFTEWMEGGVLPEETGCAAAEVYADTAGILGGQGVTELLLCSLDASSPGYQRCCGEALSRVADTPEKVLSVNPARMGLEMREALFEQLVKAVNVPVAVLMSEDAYREGLRWTAADLFHWNAHLGCDLLDQSNRQETVARRLSTSLEKQCGFAIDDPLTSSVGVNFVRHTCQGAIKGRGERVDLVEWCDAAREARSASAIEAAEVMVSRAINAFGAERMEAGIGSGNQRRRQEQIQEEEARREVMETIRRGAQGEFSLEFDDGVEMLRDFGRKP